MKLLPLTRTGVTIAQVGGDGQAAPLANAHAGQPLGLVCVFFGGGLFGREGGRGGGG